MKKYTAFLFTFVLVAFSSLGSQPVSAASCSVQVTFPGACTLWYGYGSGAKEVKVPGTITLSGSPDNPDKPTHFNCRPAPGTQGIPMTPGGWVWVDDGPSYSLPFMSGAVSMPTRNYRGLALGDGAAISCLEMIPRGN